MPESARFKLLILSYGHANGPLNIPKTEGVGKLTFNVRDVKNPPPKLRKTYTGLSPRLRKEIFANEAASARLDTFCIMLEDKMGSTESADSKSAPSTLIVGVMCDQGKHRSVAFAEELARRLQTRKEWSISVKHRDIPAGTVGQDEDEDGDEEEEEGDGIDSDNIEDGESPPKPVRTPKPSRITQKQRDQERRKSRSGAGAFFPGDS